ncbi:MAG: regulatory iron-sulfur-containing complex subunit RicT [Bacteriovoracaceae bacterium]
MSITEEISSENEVNPNSSPTNESGEESRYKEGEILKFVKVRFPGHAKSFPFLVGKRRIQYGQKVVAMSERGMTLGYVNSFPYEVAFRQEMLPLYSISKVATAKDVELQKQHSKREQEAEVYFIELIKKYNLEMELTHLEFTQFGKKAVFYFLAPARVDFRDLVKDLVNKLKMRIELRQISLRDRAAALGGLGPCGRELCCSSFLNQFGNCNIKMAKNQGLNLIPSK